MNKRDVRLYQSSFDRPLGLPTIVSRPRRSPRTFQLLHASHGVAGCFERSSLGAAIKKRLVFLFECLSNLLAHWVALPHRQQWWSRCYWMGALSRPAASDSLAFHSSACFWGPSSRTTSSPSSVGGRRQVVSNKQQVVPHDGQPTLLLRDRLNPKIHTRIFPQKI